MPVPPHIPAEWSPEQALHVVEFLDSVIAQIWHAHEDAVLHAITQRENTPDHETLQLPLFPDPDLPF